jgi:hypothetical protein
VQIVLAEKIFSAAAAFFDSWTAPDLDARLKLLRCGWSENIGVQDAAGLASTQVAAQAGHQARPDCAGLERNGRPSIDHTVIQNTAPCSFGRNMLNTGPEEVPSGGLSHG